MQPVLSRRILIYHLLSYKKHLSELTADKSKTLALFQQHLAIAPVEGIYKVNSRIIIQRNDECQFSRTLEKVWSWVQLPVQVGGHSAQGIPTQRPNTEVPTDHSNFQRAVIKLVKLNILVNKTSSVCLICSKVFSKIEKKLMLLYNTFGMLFFSSLKCLMNNNVI